MTHRTRPDLPAIPALRPEGPADLGMLMRLECGLGSYLGRLRGLSTDGARGLARLAERCRRHAVAAVWPQASCTIVEHAGAAVGRLWAHEQGEDWWLIDLALLPAARGRGLAGAALRQWLQRADAAGATTCMHLPKRHWALPWLQRHGFAVIVISGGVARLQRPPHREVWIDDSTEQIAA